MLSLDPVATLQRAEEALKVSGQGGFGSWRPVASIFHGWAIAQGGRIGDGIAEMREGLDAYRASGAGVARPAFLAALAHVYSKSKQPTEGLGVLGEAYAALRQSGEHWSEPEVHRLEGELTLELSGPDHTPAESRKKAEVCFRRAIKLATEQKAKLLELRALVSLNRVVDIQAQRASARQLLTEARNWFTEGFDAPDLVDATRLIARNP
jgi:predicted ATPase